MIRISRSIRAALAASIVAAATLMGTPAFAFVTIDGAGIETRDTASGGPATSQYVDVSATCGLACRIELADDEVVGIAPALGQPDWSFHWSSNVSTPGRAGGTLSQATVWLDSNGYIAFQQPSGPTWTPSALPAASLPNAIVAGVWADLNPSLVQSGRGVFKQITGTTPNRLMYLQWKEVPDFTNTCESFTFEFVLRESDNSVTVHYRNNPCTTRVATGGQENSAGSAGTTYFNSTAIPDNVAVQYKDVRSPDVDAPVVACTTSGTNGWCRSSTNTVTITDDNDLAGSAVGLGVKTRTWKFGLFGSQGTYASGVGNSVTRADGAHSATGTAIDWGDNGATSSATVLKIDTVAPGLSVAHSPAPNANGWNNGDVTATWMCSDATSGVVSCPAPSTIAGEGVDLTATQTIVDGAGNPKTTTTLPVKIDRTAPVTTASAPSGWSTSDAVTLTASDALSGVAATKYMVDGSAPQTGTQLQIPEGVHQVEFWSEDNAGNAESHHVVTVKVDRSAPSIVHALSPAANAAAWNRVATTVTFTCSDSVSAIAFCTPPSTHSTDGAGQIVDGTATDLAGNSAQDFAIVNLDQVPPEIGADRTPIGNVYNWNNTPVTVTYSCSDELSGIASCPAAQTFGEGAAQTASGTARDVASNDATTTIPGINVDLQVPTVTAVVSPAPNGAGWYKASVTVHWTCTDNLSGIVLCPSDVVVDDEGLGLTVSSGIVFDRAGNSVTATVSVNIDRTPPLLTYEGQMPLPNDAGWNRTAVQMLWECSDSLSGTTTPSILRNLSSETAGSNQTVTCADRAGLTSSDTQGPVRIDMTAPIASVNAPGLVPLIVGLPAATSVLPSKATGTSADLLSGTEHVVLTIDDVVTGTRRILPADCALGCNTAGIAQWAISAETLGIGLFQIRARASDIAENLGADSAPMLVLVISA